MALTFAARDQEVLFGWRGHFDLRHAQILLDDCYVDRVSGDGGGPWPSPGPLETAVDHGPPLADAAPAVPPPWGRPRGAPALVDAASAGPPPWRRLREGRALADAARAVDASECRPRRPRSRTRCLRARV